MGLTNLENVQSFTEFVFAAKGTAEHLDALDSKTPEELYLAKAGLVADAIGATQMAGDFLIDKAGPKYVGMLGENFKFLGESTPGLKSAYNPARQMKGLGTPIIGMALLAINTMQLTCGFGDSDTGGRFAKGAHGFTAISDTLKRATPTEQWHGKGSDAYAGENERQQERAATMSKIDTEVQGIIANQAEQIKKTRMVLDFAATYLGICIPVAIVIGRIPPTGPANQMVFELSAVGIAMPPALLAVTTMTGLAMQNAMKFAKAANAYQVVAAGAKPSGAPPASMSPPGGNTTPAPWSPSGGTSTGTGEGSINV
ncbi:EspA/EspE family type VII secretion system effector [Mycolicibacterium sp. HK-90]|uniref:EspA/EspE family type VII secretion system effector n=1 Tax=Mycolicibacterium sp. HK-90 TaxID=3056937 RepID=UPI002658B7CE|nr:EspA/EspE family type VII secretion system effector [Mycolicibacterium sp. HK-90]WKG04250.1 EspA/EspE family type VII secretion system effector [Mycolicibacterium sp. HK-90]